MIFGTKKHPRGPLGVWEAHELALSGALVKFRAPESNHELITGNSKLRKTLNIYDLSQFGRSEEDDVHEPLSYCLVSRDWVFTGLPLVQGVIGDMKFLVWLHHLPEFSSLFRPRRLECAVERYIYNTPTRARESGQTRLNWQLKDLGGIRWVNYGVDNCPGINNAESVRQSVWHTPISSEHLLTFSFKRIIRAKDTELDRAFNALIGKVMDSIELTLSDDAMRQKASAEKQYPWEKLAEVMPPYDFEDPELLDEWHMFRKINKEFGEAMSLEDMQAERDRRMKQQKQDAKARKTKILASHLRFESLEALDFQHHQQAKHERAG